MSLRVVLMSFFFFFSSRRRHTRYWLTGVQTCALPIYPGERGLRLRRVAVQRHLALVAGVGQLGHRRRALVDDRGVAADRQEAAVVVVPVALGVPLVLGDVVPGLHLVGGEQVLRLRLAGEGETEVEHVRRPVLAALAGDGVQLVLAGAVGAGAVDLDVVLRGEGLEHLAVVGPVRGQGDDVELTLRLGGLDQGPHATALLGRGRGGPVGAAPAGAAPAGAAVAGAA